MSAPLLTQRKCPQCGYHFEDFSTIRCPRCHKSILELCSCRGSCSSCGGGGHPAKGGCNPVRERNEK